MKTFLFDFDGTLVDSMPTYVSVMLKILDENGISYADDLIKTITPLGTEKTAEYFVETLNVPLSKEKLIERMGMYAIYEYENNIVTKKNVTEVLRKLRARGDDLNVLTASPHITLDPCLKRNGIFDLFTNIWSCDDFNTTKADPDIYVRVAEKLGKPINEIIFLDDNYNADACAKSAGMIVCGVYDESSREFVDDIKRVTDYYIYDFEELLKL